MRSPADMKVIQIEITNACLHSCSNCTRFCGHHRKPFFMDWLSFERAVDSLQGYDGIIGLMGGEPLLHPEFERMTIYLSKQHGMDRSMPPIYKPVDDFISTVISRQSANMVLNRCKGPGLWTSMPARYYKHYELIQDNFLFQNLNDHCNPSYHQPMLIARQDLGVPDEQWIKLRDDCWIQNCWSASITPRGAFFCEMAAALDTLFDGPGGWPIEPGWWKRTPDDFTDQLHWCELCGAALETTRRNANDEVDDVSAGLLTRLEEIQSPKVKKKRVVLYEAGKESSSGDHMEKWSELKRDQYIPDQSQRLGASNKNLMPRAFNAIILCGPESDQEQLELTIEGTLKLMDQVVLINALNHHGLSYPSSENEIIVNEELAQQGRVIILNQKQERLGRILYKAMHAFKTKDWAAVLTPGMVFPSVLRNEMSRSFINPGVLHSFYVNHAQKCKGDEITFFHTNSLALQRAGQDRISLCNDLGEFQSLWPEEKKVVLPVYPDQWDRNCDQEWIKTVDQDFMQDKSFQDDFSLLLTQAAPEKGPILVTQSASLFLTRGLIRLLVHFGYEPHLLTHEEFIDNFKDILPQKQMWSFDCCDMIKYDKLKSVRELMKMHVNFTGAVIPCNIVRNELEPGDGYDDVLRVAEDIARRIICRVNLKRCFVVEG